MASNCDLDEELSSNVKKKSKTNEADVPGCSNTGDIKYKCLQCPKQYKYHRSLITHIMIHDENKQIKCDICKVKIFATKHEYNQHMISHTGEKLHECLTCNQWFGRLETLKNHQYLHLEEKTFKCPECPVARYFPSPKQLSNHMLIHKKVKRHKCSICHKKFHRKANLEEHELVHTKVKAFECGICTKRFTSSGSLKRHIRSHMGEKPFKCEVCDKGFTNTSNHTRHIKNCARLMEKRQHKCSQCPKRYSLKHHLATHVKNHHNKETTK